MLKSWLKWLLLASPLLTVVVITGMCLWHCFGDNPWKKNVFQSERGIKMVSRVEEEKLLYFTEGSWQQRFWTGVNLGASTPGHHPGEHSQTYDDYRRWFKDMEELGVHLVRVYTIMPPDFYRALNDHNRKAKNKLWLVQGIWPPEEELIAEKDAYLPHITAQFDEEIDLAVRAVYGGGEIPPRRGHAYGDYRTNVAPYLLAWLVGAEWHPYMVVETNRKNPQSNSFTGTYFATTLQSSPFEAWLAARLERLAQLEESRGWQHPISFVNWVTTDPLPHPDEPLEQEDIVSVDPLHIYATSKWLAGYFASYHIYPYYPDSLRFQKEYLNYINEEGENDPYEGYVRQLKEYHRGLPLLVAEFGVPSSRGMAHRGPLGRNQGMHTEKEQGEIEVALLKAIQRADAVGGIVFEWHDEWFKFTWNTWDLEIPAERRPMWLNRLTNEENFGLLAVEPGKETKVLLDGRLEDWYRLKEPEEQTYVRFGDGIEMRVTSDEAYLYLAIIKPGGWKWEQEKLYLGFDTQEGGSSFSHQEGLQFSLDLEFLLMVTNEQEAVLKVASAYDQHTYLYGYQLKMIPWDPSWSKENSGIFLPWKLCLSKPLWLPASRESIPFEEIEVGHLLAGVTDPASQDYNSLADFYCSGEVLEVRLPWMLLGFTDPSSRQVWVYPYRQKLPYFTCITSPGVKIQLLVGKNNLKPPVFYTWSSWDIPTYHERKKQSYYVIKSFLKQFNNQYR